MIKSASIGTERLVFVRPKNPANGVQQPKQLLAIQAMTTLSPSTTKHNGQANGGLIQNERASTNGHHLVHEPLSAPTGLFNSGTSCFFNASLQCLLACPGFVHFLLNLRIFVPGKANVTDVLDMLGSHVNLLSAKAKRKVLDVSLILKAVRKSSQGAIRVHRQEDSHEAMCVLFDMMEKACLTRMGLPTGTRVDKTSESTMIHTMFGGSTTTTTSCPNCHHRSPRTESFLQLSLGLEANKALSLVELLRKMSQVERLDAKNLWECEKCKRKVMAERKTTISKMPSVLIIHLKRFGFSFLGGSMKRTKLKTPVIIGSEELTLEDTNGKKAEYSLVGVLVHRGATLNSGHYFSYVKCAANGLWYEADDEMISRVKTNQVLGEREAYMLFYSSKESLRALRPISLPRAIPIAAVIKADSKETHVKSPALSRHIATTSPASNGHVEKMSPEKPSKLEATAPQEPQSKNEGHDREEDGENIAVSTRQEISPRKRRPFFPAVLSRVQRRQWEAALVPRMLKRLSMIRLRNTSFMKTTEEHVSSPAIGHNGHNGTERKKSRIAESPTEHDPSRDLAENPSLSAVKWNTTEDEHPFSFDVRLQKKKKFDDAWDKHLDKGKVKKVRNREH